MSNFSIRELKKVDAQLNRLSEYANNKKIGYEPKCKICNSNYQNEVEALREDGYTLEEMKDYLEKHGEEVSIMSLSRHFDRHYPTRKSYLLGIDEEKARAITQGEKKIEQDIKYLPEFKEELELNHTIYNYENGDYEGITKKGRDVYIFDYGYCTTGERFCKMIPRLNIYQGSEATDNLRTEIFKINNNLVNDWMGEKKTKLLEDSLECTNCQAFYSSCTIQGLLKIVLNNLYDVSMEDEEFNKILFDEDFIFEDVDKRLKEYASRERDKVKSNS